ncbi:MAG: glycoside hydrolase family 9 protein [Cytophagaceae bacterium]
MKQRRPIVYFFLCLNLLFYSGIASAQSVWSNTDYKKALWMTTRFYGGQRSGLNNWLLDNHLPAGVPAALQGQAFTGDNDAGYDISGGWHDCGDHVIFGQTQYYAAYVLLKGYSEFPTGYDDRYTPNYAGYHAGGDWTFEGTNHDPNCIPDVLDEMKHETDFLIKAIPNATTFYSQVGDGNYDHAQWVTAVKMQTLAVNQGGETRPVIKNQNDASMVSFCGATLALMSRLYQPYNAAYSAQCLTSAVYCYNYAKVAAHQTTVAAPGGFYPANSDWKDDFVNLCCELYWTTGTAAYRTEAESYEASVSYNAGWPFDYTNNGEMALYNLAKLGISNPPATAANTSALSRFNTRVNSYYISSNRTGGLYSGGGAWGMLRYNAIAPFIISLYSKLNGNTTAAVMNPIYADIDYIMGSNASKLSFIVGFTPTGAGYTSPAHPHHRNVYLRDDNPPNADNTLTIPAKNQQFGALVGGERNPGAYPDVRSNYQYSEVCIDYNAPLVGALGYINSLKAPVTVGSACGMQCKKPALGSDLSTCTGTTLPVTLNANAGAAGGSISYKWYTWNGTSATVIGGATAQTYSATVAGSYIVERDSSATPSACVRYDTITISSTIPKPSLGGNTNLCNPASVTLSASNAASFPGGTTWKWQSASVLAGPYADITGQTASSMSNVRTAKFYKLLATAGACSNSDTVQITSSLPTPVDACGAGTVTLSITNTGAGPYNWYDASTGGTLKCTGATSCNIASPATLYVQDMGAASGTVGPTTQQGAGTNWGINAGNQMLFNAAQTFTLNSFQIPYASIYANLSTATIAVEILDGTGASFSPVKSFVSDPVNVTTAMSNSLITFPFTGFTIQSSWGPALRMRIIANPVPANQINGDLLWSAGPVTYPLNSSPAGIVSITGATGGSGDGNDYMYFYNWQISTGTPCARLPVIATNSGCTAPVELFSFYAEEKNGKPALLWATASEKNNDYFQVERSLDGEHFSTIAKVKGAGNSATILYYEYADPYPVYGVSYYRLKQVDFDGTSEYSSIISVTRNDLTDLRVAPNPFSNETTIRVSSPAQEKIQLKVMDLSGRELYSGSHNSNEDILVGADFSSGVYIIRVVAGDRIYHSKMVKN